MVDYQQFVSRYEQAWKDRDVAAFEALWDPNGVCYHPTASAPIRGREGLVAFDRRTRERTPDLSWQLDRWAAQGDHLFIEWTCRATIAGNLATWSGVDRFFLRDGRIIEEVVYCDTQQLWEALDPSLKRPALMELG